MILEITMICLLYTEPKLDGLGWDSFHRTAQKMDANKEPYYEYHIIKKIEEGKSLTIGLIPNGCELSGKVRWLHTIKRDK